jgi:hypothetical protein
MADAMTAAAAFLELLASYKSALGRRREAWRSRGRWPRRIDPFSVRPTW